MKKWLRALLVVMLGGVVGVPMTFLLTAKRKPNGNKTAVLCWISEATGRVTEFGVAGSDRVITARAHQDRPGLLVLIDPATGKTMRLNNKETASDAVLAGDLLTVAKPDSVIAFDAHTLEPVWKTKIEDATPGEQRGISFAVGRFLVWTPEALHLLDLSGQIKWSVTFEHNVARGAMVSGGKVYIVDSNRTLHVLDCVTGHRVRSVRFEQPIIGPAYPAGKLLLFRILGWVERGPCLLAWDPETGKEAWRFNSFKDDFWSEPCSPVSVENQCAYLSHGQKLFCVDLNTGTTRWEKKFEQRYEIGPPACSNGKVLVDTVAKCLALDAASGEEVWNYDRSIPNTWQKFLPSAPHLAPRKIGSVACFPQGGQIWVILEPSSIAASNFSRTASGCSIALLIIGTTLCSLVFIVAVIFHLRRLFLACCSLLLCIATLFLWFNSFRAEHFIGHRSTAASTAFRSDTCRGIVSRFGSLSFGVRQRVWDDTIRRVIPLSPRGPWCVTQEPLIDPAFPVVTPPWDLGVTNFGWSHASRWSGTALGDQVNKTMILPHWVVVLFFAIWPLAWLTGFWRDRRRYPKGCCKKCGYDLRVGHDVCPECGQPIGTATQRV